MIGDHPGGLGALPLSAAARLDGACDRFEAGWRAGGWPRIEDYLVGADPAHRAALLEELLAAELEWRRRRGERPVAEDYRARFPDDGELVARAFGGPAGGCGDAAGGGTTTAVLAALAKSYGPLPRVLLREPDPEAVTEPVAQPASAEMPAPPDRTGRLHLLGELARGGMGAVLKGRDMELGRDLAVKVLLERHRGSAELARRFLEEAQIAGQLQHPGVVPVYELGTLADRRPYFSMKLVKGQTLSALLAARPSPADGRPRFLGVFEQVCQTVAYAHARGVIHRDLKPSNVMVGSFGEVQVMDWGLAKVLPRGGVADDERAGKVPDQETVIATARSGGDSDADRSRAGSVMGTPAYMAPEQARGEIDLVDERADVFALGSILCEVLTGRPAFVGRSSAEVQRQAARGETADALARLDGCGADAELVGLARDCLAAGLEGRPRDARAVADRVTAHLAGVQERLRAAERDRAVAEARAEEERSKRRWQLGLAVAVAAALLLGGVGLAAFTAAISRQKGELARANAALDRQRRRAEDREQQAIAAVKRFRDAVADNPALKDDPALEGLRKALLKEPLAFFRALRDRLQADGDTRPESLARLAAASFDLGELTEEVGDSRDALAAYREARAIWQGLADDHPDQPDYRRDLAQSLNRLGALLSDTGQPAEGRVAFEAARAIGRRLAEAHPDEPAYRGGLAVSHNNLGNLHARAGHPAEAQAEYRAAIAIQGRLAEAHPDEPAHRRELARSHRNLGLLLHATGRPAEAQKAFEAARAIGARLAEAHPDEPTYRRDLALSHSSLGALLSGVGHPAEARAEYEAAIAIQGRLAEAHPAVTAYQRDLAHDRYSLGHLLQTSGAPAEARAEYEAAIAIRRRLAEAHPAVTAYQRDLARSQLNLGVLWRDAGRPAEARAAFEAARAIWQRLADDHPDQPDYRRDLAASTTNLAALLQDSGQPAEARAAYEDVRSIQQRLVEAHPESPGHASDLGRTQNNLAVLDLADRRFDAAAGRLREAIARQKDALAANPRDPDYRRSLRAHYTNLRKAAVGLDDPSLAAEARRGLAELEAGEPRHAALLARLAATQSGQPPRDNAERLALARLAFNTGQYVAAARLWTEALEADPGLVADRRAQHPYNAACAAALAASGLDRDDPEPSAAARAAWRRRALGWLRVDLAAWSKLLGRGDPEDRPVVARALRHWRIDPDLAGVRGEAELAGLPEAERADWRSFWSDLSRLLEETEGAG